MRAWLRKWLGIEEMSLTDHIIQDEVLVLKQELASLRSEIAQLRVAQYVPPQTPEPKKPKPHQARTMKEFHNLVEQENQEMERSSA